ncbi:MULTISPECIES: methionine synthase [unclassified Rhodococcus (in: high G+C Gram-positive bacteria)]|uniref:methionine synthase n=1 Tax=unclassified Rhodococcus (in: high G+C Gram-positive bacteria) TaxID=192944 RepID=UPI001639B404|nr:MULTISPECIES: methionine synthase [unclassified Rhodococcus (in: high G+C Gram-positive bacteria)]MBC2643662.1 methionine synthase [Rhodococcus sp. 3A]MBC2891597.1 methionine synthase [Rhodococcus sp. 4CII]
MTQAISLAGAVTGVGSWPGTDPREAATIVLGELGRLPHLVELPARGLGADMIGRACALLVDLQLDVSTTAYRVVQRRGSVAKRAADLLNQDLDALEEAWETAGLVGADHVVKVQSVGPLTLAAEVELGTGRRVLTDPGAVRDFAESLGEGLARHAAEVTRRLGTQVLIQFDEPRLPAVLAGTLSGRTRLETVRAMPEPEALAVLEATLTGSGGVTMVHCCSGSLPADLLRRSSARAVGLDVAQLTAADLDGIGELLDAGKELALGLVPTAAPAVPATWRDLARPAVTLIDRLGFPRTTLRSQVAVTPACGLAGAGASWSREALKSCAEVSSAFTDDPESL